MDYHVTWFKEKSQLQDTEITSLQLIADGQSGLAFAQARQVLNAYYDFNYLKLPGLPEMIKEEQEGGTKNLQSETGNRPIASSVKMPTKFTELSFAITPNPAPYKVRFRFNWPENTADFADLKVMDMRGREVYSERVFKDQNSLYWQVDTKLKEGVYYCLLQIPGYIVPPQKLILIK